MDGLHIDEFNSGKVMSTMQLGHDSCYTSTHCAQLLPRIQAPANGQATDKILSRPFNGPSVKCCSHRTAVMLLKLVKLHPHKAPH